LKREIVLSIIILAIFILVTLCIVKTSNVGRRLSELKVEREHSCNVSVSVTCVPILLLKANETNLTNTDTKQDHLQANDQLNFSTDLADVTTPEVCASQWLHDVITVGEMLHCVGDYMKIERLKTRG